MELLKVENLSVEIGVGRASVKAVRDVSFSLQDGEILAVCGESGCGKSMLCKSIMGLLPKSGKIADGEKRRVESGRCHHISEDKHFSQSDRKELLPKRNKFHNNHGDAWIRQIPLCLHNKRSQSRRSAFPVVRRIVNDNVLPWFFPFICDLRGTNIFSPMILHLNNNFCNVYNKFYDFNILGKIVHYRYSDMRHKGCKKSP